jgi:hypothetical protein
MALLILKESSPAPAHKLLRESGPWLEEKVRLDLLSPSYPGYLSDVL